jgi:hypothetical protein
MSPVRRRRGNRRRSRVLPTGDYSGINGLLREGRDEIERLNALMARLAYMPRIAPSSDSNTLIPIEDQTQVVRPPARHGEQIVRPPTRHGQQVVRPPTARPPARRGRLFPLSQNQATQVVRPHQGEIDILDVHRSPRTSPREEEDRDL